MKLQSNLKRNHVLKAIDYVENFLIEDGTEDFLEVMLKAKKRK
jgi:hypothetical protein